MLLVTVVAVAVVAVVIGCGNRVELPIESRGGAIPATNTYAVKQVWQGFDGAADVLFTSGSQVLVSFPAEGRVVGYFSSGAQPKPNGKQYAGVAPTYLAEGPGRTLVVGDVDSTGSPVVRVYDQGSAVQVVALADTSWGAIGGIAADADGNIYVADPTAIRVWKYNLDGELMLQISEEGSGIGYVQEPDGLEWRAGRLLVVDRTMQTVKVLDPEAENGGASPFQFDGDESPFGDFQGLDDVAGDDAGYLYVVDRLSAVVLKYDIEGTVRGYDQRVDENADIGGVPLVAPVAVSASKRLAYVLDAGDGKIVTFELDIDETGGKGR